MLAPMIAIGVKCAYVVCNRNAYLNYSGRQFDEYTHIEPSNLQLNTEYHWSNSLIPNTSYTGQPTDIFMTGVNNVIGTTSNLTNATRLRVYRSGTTYMYLAFYNGDTSLAYVNGQTTALSFDFTLTGLTNAGPNDSISAFNYIYTIDNAYGNYLDNVFYSAVNDMNDSTLFNWAENTAIYSGINAMNTGFGLTNNTISLLLAYWSILTAIYIVFDIIIVMFTKITHLVSLQKE